jgi:DNA-binding MarR family transcriptional regulator
MNTTTKGELKQDLLHSLFCFKKASIAISRFLNAGGGGLSTTEISALGCIGRCDKKSCAGADRTTHHAMHETLAVSKAAVSQMLGSLEKRGYIRREIDTDNRRKIIITLTKKGKAAVDTSEKEMDLLMSRIITRFGEKDSRTFVQLLRRFSELADESVGKTG